MIVEIALENENPPQRYMIKAFEISSVLIEILWRCSQKCVSSTSEMWTVLWTKFFDAFFFQNKVQC